MRPAAAVIAITCGLLAGCGSGGQAADTSTGAAPSGSLEALWRAPGEDVAIVPGTSDYGPGRNRVSFLVVDGQSQLVERPTARVWIARDLKEEPYEETVAHLEHIGVPGGDSGAGEADAQAIYVAEVETPEPGKYWLLAEPVGGTPIQALGNVVVGKDAAAPGVGRSNHPVIVPMTVRQGRLLQSTFPLATSSGVTTITVTVRDATRRPALVQDVFVEPVAGP